MSDTIKCPYCAEEIKEEAKICKHCKQDLTNEKTKILIKNQVFAKKAEAEKKEMEELQAKLKDKTDKYPDNIRKGVIADKKFLEKLKDMNKDDIEKDIFKRLRNRSLKFLWIPTILISFSFPLILILNIWLHPAKDETKLFINRIKDFKKYKIRTTLSAILGIIFIFIMFAAAEVVKEEAVEQAKVEKVNSTILKATYDIKENITFNENIIINLDLSNIQKVEINDKEIDLGGKNVFDYTYPLSLGKNNIKIVGYNDDIKRELTKSVERVTEEEYNKAIEEEKARVEAKKIKDEEDKIKAQDLREKEAFNKAKERLDREIASINKFDGSKYRDDVLSINIEVALFGAYVIIYDEYKNNSNAEIKRLAETFKSKVIQLQAREFPQLRKAYGKLLDKTMWEHNIDITTKGSLHSTIELTGAIFANNKNTKDTYSTLRDMLKILRYDRANFKWYKYDDEYTYYTITSLGDKVFQAK